MYRRDVHFELHQTTWCRDYAIEFMQTRSSPWAMTTDQMTFQRRTKGLTVYKTGHNVAATASEMGFETVNLNADEWNALAL